MKTHFLILVLVAALIGFTSCRKEYGEGNIISETRSINSFTEIDLRCSADVEIYKGAVQSIEVSDYENLLEYLEVRTSGNTLIIETNPHHVFLQNSEAKVSIVIPDVITDIEISGSGNVYINDSLNNLQSVEISGSGTLTGSPASYKSTINAEVSGSGEIELNGDAPSISTEISGSGQIYFRNLFADHAISSISGSGSTTVNVSNSLKANISGSGCIYYYGNPSVSSSITGSGKVIKK